MPGDRYRRGAHTVLELKYHFVWKTEYSYRVLRGDVGLRLRALIRQIGADKGIAVVKGNVRPNHIHLLVNAPAYLSPAKMAQYLTGRSSYRLQREFPELRKRYWGQHLWSKGYFCATVGSVGEKQVQDYIGNQTDEKGPFEVWDETREENGRNRSFRALSKEIPSRESSAMGSKRPPMRRI